MERGRRAAHRHVIEAGKQLGEALAALDGDDSLRHSIDLHVQILIILIRGLAASEDSPEGGDVQHRPSSGRAASMHNRYIRTMD